MAVKTRRNSQGRAKAASKVPQLLPSVLRESRMDSTLGSSRLPGFSPAERSPVHWDFIRSSFRKKRDRAGMLYERKLFEKRAARRHWQRAALGPVKCGASTLADPLMPLSGMVTRSTGTRFAGCAWITGQG